MSDDNREFPTADSGIIKEIINLGILAAGEIPIFDADMAPLVREARLAKREQKSVALFTYTLPPVVELWANAMRGNL